MEENKKELIQSKRKQTIADCYLFNSCTKIIKAEIKQTEKAILLIQSYNALDVEMEGVDFNTKDKLINYINILNSVLELIKQIKKEFLKAYRKAPNRDKQIELMLEYNIILDTEITKKLKEGPNDQNNIQ